MESGNKSATFRGDHRESKRARVDDDHRQQIPSNSSHGSSHDRTQCVLHRDERTRQTEAVRRAAHAAALRAGAAFAPGAASVGAVVVGSRATIAAEAREGRDAPYAGVAAAAAAVAAPAGVCLAPGASAAAGNCLEYGDALPDYSDKYELLWGGGGPDGMPSALLTKLNEEMAKRGVTPVEIGQLGPEGVALESILACVFPNTCVHSGFACAIHSQHLRLPFETTGLYFKCGHCNRACGTCIALSPVFGTLASAGCVFKQLEPIASQGCPVCLHVYNDTHTHPFVH